LANAGRKYIRQDEFDSFLTCLNLRAGTLAKTRSPKLIKHFFRTFCHFLFIRTFLILVVLITSIFKGEKMKNIFCVALILIGTLAAFAQERAISKEELDAVLKHPNRLPPIVWRDKSYRTVLTTEVKSEGKVQLHQSSKGIIEYVPRVGSRLISESKSGSKITKTESITIGDKIYKRNENEAWTVEVKSETKRADTKPAASTFKDIDRQTEYKYLGTEMLNNQTTKVYESIEKIKSIDTATNEERIGTITTKYWFNEDGISLKEEVIGESRTGANTSYYRLTKAWELDPNIKIETPVVN
jgi:hypothetical protein